MFRKVGMLIIVSLVLTACTTDTNLTKSIEDLAKQVQTLENYVEALQNEVVVLKEQVDIINVYGNGVYYCANHMETYESIEFLSATVIRVLIKSYDHGEIDVMANSYFKVESTGKGLFTLVEDIPLSDTFGSYSMTDIEAGWDAAANDFLKKIEITQDHQTLYYGSDHTKDYCKFNQIID